MTFATKLKIIMAFAYIVQLLPRWVYGRSFLLNVMFGYMIINSMHEARKHD